MNFLINTYDLLAYQVAFSYATAARTGARARLPPPFDGLYVPFAPTVPG
jgi:hypothetical protein